MLRSFGQDFTEPTRENVESICQTRSEPIKSKDTPPWKNKIMKLKSKNSIIFLNSTPEAIVNLVRQKVLLTYDRKNFSSS